MLLVIDPGNLKGWISGLKQGRGRQRQQGVIEQMGELSQPMIDPVWGSGGLLEGQVADIRGGTV